jgi:hypothetical protein
MFRTQITLDEEQHRFLKKRADAMGVSLSEMIRRAVDELRAREAALPKRAIDLLPLSRTAMMSLKITITISPADPDDIGFY